MHERNEVAFCAPVVDQEERRRPSVDRNDDTDRNCF